MVGVDDADVHAVAVTMAQADEPADVQGDLESQEVAVEAGDRRYIVGIDTDPDGAESHDALPTTAPVVVAKVDHYR